MLEPKTNKFICPIPRRSVRTAARGEDSCDAFEWFRAPGLTVVSPHDHLEADAEFRPPWRAHPEPRRNPDWGGTTLPGPPRETRSAEHRRQRLQTYGW